MCERDHSKHERPGVRLRQIILPVELPRVGVMTFREWFREAAPGILLIFAIGIFWTAGYNGVWYRARIDVEGTVTARKDFPPNKYTHGPTTRYTLKTGDGTIREYTATHAEPSLPRTIPVGVSVTKRKGEMFYSLNGRRIDDFPLRTYVIVLGVGIAFMIGAGILLVRDNWHGIRARAP
jgi:hypothetical protein